MTRKEITNFDYQCADSGGSTTMKKILCTSVLTAFTFAMLLPVAHQVNAASVNQTVLHQGTNPMPGGHGGGFQGTNPMPGGHGGGFQGTNPMPGGHGGGFQGTNPMPGGHGGGIQ
jgi:hypothetical protein